MAADQLSSDGRRAGVLLHWVTFKVRLIRSRVTVGVITVQKTEQILKWILDPFSPLIPLYGSHAKTPRRRRVNERAVNEGRGGVCDISTDRKGTESETETEERETLLLSQGEDGRDRRNRLNPSVSVRQSVLQ
ncbi:Hypothetical predicted protein [Xyrichtys novacula]|uniref:Uncharacterized protein n=1 Tax=Xyrichtys novacula TaxID=13765 RepID=A0AAV1HDZ3_XYRNO|nr:Hypothetical predicted protein [Xyrichtys novacula]